MNTLITCNKADDPNFIFEVNSILLDKISEFQPSELFISYIDNWFDSKWLNFSGTVVHEVSVWRSRDITTIPPFNPNRVIYSNKLIRKDHFYSQIDDAVPLHVFQVSSANLKRKIADVTRDGLFIWYSSNTNVNDQGSILIYYVKDADCLPVYLNLVKKPDSSWNLKTLIEK